LRKWRNENAAVALIPFRPGGSVENPWRGVIERRFEIVVAEVFPNNFDVLIGRVCHRIGEKPRRELQRFFRCPKPEDALCDGQKVLGMNHRSLPRAIKSRFPISMGSSSNSTALAALRNAFCIDSGSLGRSPSAKYVKARRVALGSNWRP